MLLITGATGNAGSAVVRALLERGAPARVFVRDTEKARGLFGDDVEVVRGDFADPESFRAAVRGAKAMVLSCADDPRRVEWEKKAIDAATAADVQMIVKLSTLGARPGAPVAFWDWHGQVEKYLIASGVPSVILQSSYYMSNVFANAAEIARSGRLHAPAGDARIAMIDPRDVGAVAAAVLATDDLVGRTYALTGPESITYRQVAAALGSATGREIEFVHVPPEVARCGMVEAGLPEFVADQVVRVFEKLREGVAADVTTAVESLTGAPAHTFAEFAREYANLFVRAPVVAGR